MPLANRWPHHAGRGTDSERAMTPVRSVPASPLEDEMDGSDHLAPPTTTLPDRLTRAGAPRYPMTPRPRVAGGASSGSVSRRISLLFFKSSIRSWRNFDSDALTDYKRAHETSSGRYTTLPPACLQPRTKPVRRPFDRPSLSAKSRGMH
jgi:hypothetical protein